MSSHTEDFYYVLPVCVSSFELLCVNDDNSVVVVLNFYLFYCYGSTILHLGAI